ncbi:hypothetical protein KR032_001939 [Drosophila birchii]|nr:hypothetical protein KR032_001939 [Drosophila birchii]
MKLLIAFALVAVASADVSHLFSHSNNLHEDGYHYGAPSEPFPVIDLPVPHETAPAPVVVYKPQPTPPRPVYHAPPAGVLKDDGYHYGEPSIPFPVTVPPPVYVRPTPPKAEYLPPPTTKRVYVAPPTTKRVYVPPPPPPPSPPKVEYLPPPPTKKVVYVPPPPPPTKKVVYVPPPPPPPTKRVVYTPPPAPKVEYLPPAEKGYSYPNNPQPSFHF